VIFFEYDDDNKREQLFITSVVHGARDMDAYLGGADDPPL
jgi:hypothetical protein